MLTITQVAAKINVSVFTINRWYRYERNNNLDTLPMAIKKGNTKYFKDSDIPKFLEFKNKIIKGRNGVMSNGK